MPLRKGKSQAAISYNIKELTDSMMKHGGKGGKRQSKAVAHKRAVAAALHMAGMGLKKPE